MPTIEITAFPSDVRCLNAHLTHPKAWIAKTYGLTAPLEAVRRDPKLRLGLFEARVTVEGARKLEADATTHPDCRRLALSTGEAFGLLLALWRWTSSPAYDERNRRDYRLSLCLIAAHKETQAMQMGALDDAARFTTLHAALVQELETARADEQGVEVQVGRMLGSGRASKSRRHVP